MRPLPDLDGDRRRKGPPGRCPEPAQGEIAPCGRGEHRQGREAQEDGGFSLPAFQEEPPPPAQVLTRLQGGGEDEGRGAPLRHYLPQEVEKTGRPGFKPGGHQGRGAAEGHGAPQGLRLGRGDKGRRRGRYCRGQGPQPAGRRGDTPGPGRPERSASPAPEDAGASFPGKIDGCNCRCNLYNL